MQAQGRYVIADNLRIAPDLTFFFPKDKVTGLDVNVNSVSYTHLDVYKRQVGNRTITATMENNAAAQDFLSRLPFEVTLNDYNNITEKIFYPSPALPTAGVTRGCAPVPGDITIYVPWNRCV